MQERTMSDQSIPKPDFLTYLHGFVTQILIHLGEVDNPIQGGRTVNFQLAKHSIDLLQIISDKTEGNLSDEEKTFLGSALYDLRMKYVAKSR